MHIIFVFIVTMFFTGCSFFDITPRIETVIDKEYVYTQCPTFNYDFKVVGSKLNNDISYNGNYVVLPTDILVTNLTSYKYAVDTFNKQLLITNKSEIVPGIPTISNFKRVKKVIFIDRKCIPFKYKVNIPVRKYNRNKEYDNYVIIKTINLIQTFEKFKMSKKLYNKSVK